MIKCTITEHPAVKDGFHVLVEEVREGTYPLFIVAREFKLGDRNDNFMRAIEFSRVEIAAAIAANTVVHSTATSQPVAPQQCGKRLCDDGKECGNYRMAPCAECPVLTALPLGCRPADPFMRKVEKHLEAAKEMDQ